MAQRFELHELDDVATFLELIEESGETAFVTIGGRDKFAVIAASKYASMRADLLQAQKQLESVQAELEEERGRADVLQSSLDDAESRLDALCAQAAPVSGASTMVPTSDPASYDGSSSAVTGAGSDVPAGGMPVAAQVVPSEEAQSMTEVVGTHEVIKPIAVQEYVCAQLPETPIDSDDYQRSMWQEAICDRMRKTIAAEAPIEKQRLFNMVRGSFGIKRSGRDTQSHNEWLFNRFIDAQQTQFNDSFFVWRSDQDPTVIHAYRPYDEENGRQITEFAYEELAAAIVAAYDTAKSYSFDGLIEAAMRLLGYKRKTNRVREVIGAAITQATNEGILRTFTDGTLRL